MSAVERLADAMATGEPVTAQTAAALLAESVLADARALADERAAEHAATAAREARIAELAGDLVPGLVVRWDAVVAAVPAAVQALTRVAEAVAAANTAQNDARTALDSVGLHHNSPDIPAELRPMLSEGAHKFEIPVGCVMAQLVERAVAQVSPATATEFRRMAEHGLAQPIEAAVARQLERIGA